MGRDAGAKISARVAVAALLVLALSAVLAGCAGASSSVAHTQPTNTPLVFPTRTPSVFPPRGDSIIASDWVRVAAGRYGSAQFAASDPQRGYLCATDYGGAGRIFGISIDGGQTWQLKSAPTAYITCAVVVSPTDPLKLTLSSINVPGDGQTAFVDAFASADGGQTWQSLPIPPNTLGSAGALWVGSNLFLYIGANKGQAPSLRVSANSGAFTPVDMSTLIPNYPDPYIGNVLASGDTLYVTMFGLCTPNCTVLAATSDGGKTWRHLANPLNLTMDAMVGNTLYAHAFSVGGPAPLRVMRSTDGGATWSEVNVPPLPGGSSPTASPTNTAYVVAPDGTIFTATPHAVYALRGQTWTAITFAISGTWGVDVTAVATDAAGHPTRVFVSYEGPKPGQFSHTV